MTQEEKQILHKDLCARLPYGVQVSINDKIITTLKNLKVTHFYNDTNTVQDTFVQVDISDGNDWVDITNIKPYLRSMSSMTEEEQQKYYDLTHQEDDDIWGKCLFDKMVDFCNENHLDYRGLIEKGLALEAPEGMYKEK